MRRSPSPIKVSAPGSDKEEHAPVASGRVREIVDLVKIRRDPALGDGRPAVAGAEQPFVILDKGGSASTHIGGAC